MQDQFGFSGNAPLGAALAITLLAAFAVAFAVLAGAGFVALRTMQGLARRGAAWGRRGGAVSRTLRRAPWIHIALGAILVFLYTPLIIVVVVSFNTSTAGIFPLKGLTLDWYAKLLGDAVFHDAIEASLIVAFSTVAITLAIGARPPSRSCGAASRCGAPCSG